MKKKEVEEAKHKVEEPDPATEAKEEGEPVYQVVITKLQFIFSKNIPTLRALGKVGPVLHHENCC